MSQSPCRWAVYSVFGCMYVYRCAMDIPLYSMKFMCQAIFRRVGYIVKVHRLAARFREYKLSNYEMLVLLQILFMYQIE